MICMIKSVFDPKPGSYVSYCHAAMILPVYKPVIAGDCL